MVDYSSMTVDEALAYCYRHKREYMRDLDERNPGRLFDCLISILESGHITPSQLPEYGMDYEG